MSYQQPNQPQQPPSDFWQPPQQNYGPPPQPYGYNPPPYQQPPTPPRKKGVLDWYRRQTRTARILIVIFAIVIVIGGISSIANAANGSNSSPQATISTDAQTATAFVAPTDTPFDIPTDTPVPAVAPTQAPSGYLATHGTPRLGGPLSDFVGAYGQPNSNSNPPLFDFMETNNINGVSIVGLGFSCPSAQCIGAQKIDDVTLQSPDQNAGFTVSEAEIKCMAFAPTDARFKQKIPYADNSGYDMVYTSASLARAFPASEFSDGNGGTVAPGTFDVAYLYANNKQGIGSCDMITGEQQTHP